MCWGIRMLKIGDKVKSSYGYYRTCDYGEITDKYYNKLIGIEYKIKSEAHGYYWRIECELLKIVTICA